MPFKPLTAAQLQRAAASDDGAHRVAEQLLERQLPANTARTALLEGLCSSLTRRVRHTNGAHLVSSVFLRLLATMPLRLLVILLGCSHCSNQRRPRVPLLQALGRSASDKPAAASLMHTMAWSHRRTGSPATHSPLTSVACASSTSCLVQPSPTCATSTLSGDGLRTVCRMATLALRQARLCSLKGSLLPPSPA